MTKFLIKHFKIISFILFSIMIIGVVLCLKDFLALGFILIFISAGLENVMRFICKAGTNHPGGIIKGADYLLKMIFKEHFNQVYNLYTGILLLLIGFIIIIVTII